MNSLAGRELGRRSIADHSTGRALKYGFTGPNRRPSCEDVPRIRERIQSPTVEPAVTYVVTEDQKHAPLTYTTPGPDWPRGIA